MKLNPEMKLNPDEIELLELATEDYYELFTTDWRLRALCPDRPDLELRQRAQQAIRNLWANGLVTFLYCSRWIGGTYTPVPTEEDKALLENPDNWEKPDTDETGYFCYTSTSKGDQVYQNDDQVRFYLRQVRHI